MRAGSTRAPGPFPALLVALLTAAPLAAQQTHAVVAAGLGGQEPYTSSFREWAVAFHGALVQRHGAPAGNVTVLAEDPAAHPLITRRSTKENLLAALAETAGRAGPDDRIVVVLIGHGTAQRNEARLNLPGPDLTPDELATALDRFGDRPVAVVHTGSASGGFVPALSAPGRIVVTATASPLERNATEFPRYFLEAVSGEGADLDKDGRTSLLEAFEYAIQEVARFYAEENEVLTEHALLDDDGDGEGSRTASREAGDGTLAATFHFGSGPAASAATGIPDTMDPELARLYRERAAIQARIDELRAAKGGMSEEAYEEQLEVLLVELALKAREVRAREGGGR